MNDFNSIPLTIKRSKKRYKTIAIAIDPARGIILQVPQLTLKNEIARVLKIREPWIIKKWSDFQSRFLQKKNVEFGSGAKVLFSGIYYKLEIFPLFAKQDQCEIVADTILIRLKRQDTRARAAQVKHVLERWYRRQAELILTERTDFFAEKMHLEPRGIVVKAQKNIWGSCSRDNTIRYNWKIIMAEPALLDYLVVHELAHIQEKNHSANFWKLVETALPDYTSRRRALRAFHVDW